MKTVEVYFFKTELKPKDSMYWQAVGFCEAINARAVAMGHSFNINEMQALLGEYGDLILTYDVEVNDIKVLVKGKIDAY